MSKRRDPRLEMAIQAKKNQYGTKLIADLMGSMQSQFKEFKSNLEKFAINNKKQINEDPIFRKQFHQMCLDIGVDPMSSKKGMLGGALGLGDFYYGLGIQVLNICIALRKKTGGFVEMSDCLRYLRHIRGSAASEVGE